MPSLIFLVEDNPNSLYYTKKILETNNYEVITADNGKTALKVLSQIEQLPEIIISDIMMPKMNGYDFFRAVTEKPILNQIPFLFLSALDKPEDIRFGKILGVDDYITKPFEAEDLMACVAGKIARNKRIYEYNKMVKENRDKHLQSDMDFLLNKEDNISLLLVQWDDLIGPNLIKHYTENVSLPISIKELGQQLYQSAVSIYGQDNFGKAEGILLKIKNINSSGYLLFDASKDNTFRSGEREFMLAIIAPMINYFQSLKLKLILKSISLKIKKKETWQIKDFWVSIVDVLTKQS